MYAHCLMLIFIDLVIPKKAKKNPIYHFAFSTLILLLPVQYMYMHVFMLIWGLYNGFGGTGGLVLLPLIKPSDYQC